jgi:hypothetical protein
MRKRMNTPSPPRTSERARGVKLEEKGEKGEVVSCKAVGVMHGEEKVCRVLIELT